MKHLRTALSVLLILATAFVYYLATPAKALADKVISDKVAEQIEVYADANQFLTDTSLEYSPLLGEIDSLRSESVKHFRRADGAIEAVTYPFPVHFEKNGEWHDINNTLSAVKDSEGNVVGYENANGDISVFFAASQNTDNLVRYAISDTQSLSWKFEGLPAVTAAVTQQETAAAQMTDEEKDMKLRFPDALSSEIAYVNEQAGISIKYVLTSNILSEYITIQEKPEEALCYTLTLDASGLEPKQTSDGKIVLLDANQKEVLAIGSPVMSDASGEQSASFNISLQENKSSASRGSFGGTYTYVMEPSMDFLEDAEYPVVIDPDIRPTFRGTVEDTYISSTDRNANYNTRDRLKIGGGNHYRSLIRITGLPQLNAGDVVVQSSLNLSRYNDTAYGKEIDLRRVLVDWDVETVTWNSLSPDSSASVDLSRVESFVMSQAQNNFNVFDITSLVKSWYSDPSSNHGVILQSYNDNNTWYTEYRSSNYNSTYETHPYFSVIYVNSTGLEGRFTYYSQDAGRAGVGSINGYSGNLTFAHADASINNGAMPISLSHVYNVNDRTENIGYGYGWRLNYSQSITKVELQNRTETATYYCLIDGDGTRHYYKEGSNANEYVNELDKDSVLNISGTTATITDKGDNKLIFSCDSAVENGRLTAIEDANGNRVDITYTSAMVTNLRIASVTEKLAGNSEGQTLTLNYTDSLLVSVDSPDGLDVNYTYSSSKLTGIEYTDGNAVSYVYDENKCLARTKNIDNYNINYEYTPSAPYRVVRAEEKANTTAGQYIEISYGWSTTTVTDAQGRRTIYQFDTNGQPVSVRDPEGRAVYAAYNQAEQTVTQLSAVSKMQNTSVNLLKNHGFDKSGSWTMSDSTYAAYSNTYAQAGENSLKLVSSSSRTVYAQQSIAVTAGRTYTLSGYFTGQSGAVLQVLNSAADTVLFTSDAVQTDGTTGTDWTRGILTFTVPEGISSVCIRIKLPSSSVGTVYADSIQLETGAVPNRYNMIQNGDFSDGITAWDENGRIDSATDGVMTDTNTSHPTILSDSVYHVEGVIGFSKCIEQEIAVNGKTGDTYSFGAWMRSDSIPLNRQSVDNTLYGIRRITVEFTNGSNPVNDVMIYGNADTTEWQYLCGSAVAQGNYTKIKLSLEFIRSLNDCCFDGVQLYKETFSQAYTYDEEGNLTGYASLIGQDNSFEYDDNDNLTSFTDANGNETTYTYYDPDSASAPNDNPHLTESSTSAEGVTTSYEYNSMGLTTETIVGDEASGIVTSTMFNAATGLASAVTDARGNSVTYTYDPATRQQQTITDPKGNVSTYSYGDAESMLRLASITGTDTGTVNYTYDTHGKLTRIARESTYYNFTYDAWGRVASTKVGNTTLSTNTYDEYGRLSCVTYGNGFKTIYTYDSLDRVSTIRQKANEDAAETLVYEFVYNGEGDLYELRNYKILRATFFEYDHAGRCMASTEKSITVSGGAVSYGATVSGYEYRYDNNNNLSRLTCNVAGRDFSTVYTYDGDNRASTATLHNGKVITNIYDALGRLTTRRLALAGNYNTTLTYVSNADGTQTTLLSTYKNGSDSAYSYTYDANGNITRIAQGGTAVDYIYDGANQLVRENNDFTDETVVYEYDEWGNITRKLTYGYTTQELDVFTPAPVTCTLSYNANISNIGLNRPPVSQTTAYGQSLQVANIGFSLLAYTFDGWNTAADGSGTSYDAGDTIVMYGDVLLYAQWTSSGGGIIVPIPTPSPTHDIMSVPASTNSDDETIYPTEVMCYAYDDEEWGDQLSSISTYSVNATGQTTLTDTQTFTYDAMGNPTSYDGTTLTWEGKQLSGAGTTTFSYDENGLRTRKTVDGTVTDYYYNGSVLIGMVTGTGSTAVHRFFSYDASGNVVSVDYSSDGGSTFTTYYYLRNGQNDVVKLIDNSGDTVVEYTYDTWGKVLSCTGTLATTLGANQPFRYRGYVYDTETGWYYLQSRYYSPETCRFISADVLLSTGQGVLGHNSFAYCGNNPITRIDSEGEFWHIVAGAVIGLVSGLVSCLIDDLTSEKESDINVWDYVACGLIGAVEGAAIAAAPAFAIPISVAASCVEVGVKNAIIHGDTFDPEETAYELVISCGMSVLTGGLGGGGADNVLNKGAKAVVELLFRSGKSLQKVVKQLLWRQVGHGFKQFGIELASELFQTSCFSVLAWLGQKKLELFVDQIVALAD